MTVARWIAAARRAQARTSALSLPWWWGQQLGLPGVLAVVLAGLALAVVLAVRPGLAQADRAQQRQLSAALQATAARNAAAPLASQRDPLEVWLEALPPATRRGESIAQLLALLGRGGVAAGSADYLAEDHEPGLLRVHVTVPIQGGYLPTRQLVAAVLTAMPHAALDAITLDRGVDAGHDLTGQLRLSLFFRKVPR
jgi:hypothetical protein